MNQNATVALGLSALVIGGLVYAATRGRPPAPGGQNGTPPPGGTSPDSPPPDTTPPDTTPPPPTVKDLVFTYHLLMSRMQSDIRSVDPAALDALALQFAVHPSLSSYAAELRTWAGCVRTALDDDSYFPRACGPYSYEPAAKMQVAAALLARYRHVLASPLTQNDVPGLDALEGQLRRAGLKVEADEVRARRDQIVA